MSQPVSPRAKVAAKVRETSQAGKRKMEAQGAVQAGAGITGKGSGKTGSEGGASELIDGRIRSLEGWRGATLAELRRLIREADPEIAEEWKWEVPVWSRGGIVCTGEAYKQAVKLTFARGASLADPRRLFNSSLEGKTRRAIDLREGEVLDAEAFKALIRAAVAENMRVGAEGAAWKRGNAAARSKAKAGGGGMEPADAGGGKVVLLSGGNPQIAKADGDAPVQAYIAAMPGWKSALGKRLDALIVKNVPGVRKAVRWNSPFYGVEGGGWFVSFHVLTKYVKVTFFAGKSLRPIPPGGTPKSGESRWIDIYEDDELNESQMGSWMKQAASLPGWVP